MTTTIGARREIGPVAGPLATGLRLVASPRPRVVDIAPRAALSGAVGDYLRAKAEWARAGAAIEHHVLVAPRHGTLATRRELALLAPELVVLDGLDRRAPRWASEAAALGARVVAMHDGPGAGGDDEVARHADLRLPDGVPTGWPAVLDAELAALAWLM